MQSSVPLVLEDQEQTAQLLACIVKEFEGLVKQLWVYAQRNPHAGFTALEERARQLRSECFASALQSAAQLHRTHIDEALKMKSGCWGEGLVNAVQYLNTRAPNGALFRHGWARLL